MASVGRLDDKVALVTGASSGIGAGTAILFSQLGAHVIITGRNEQNLKKTAEQCSQDKYKPVLLIGDLTKEEDTRRIVDEAIAAAGRLDILVNNAGVYLLGSIEEASLEDFDKLFNTNVRSVYNLTRLCIPHLVKTKGNVINVSSYAGLNPFPGSLPYCMSKSAVDHMSRCMALEMAPKQVRVNAVNPIVINTDIFRRAGLSEEENAKLLEESKGQHALDRVGEVIDVANLIAFLASDSASFMTGNTIPVGCKKGLV